MKVKKKYCIDCKEERFIYAYNRCKYHYGVYMAKRKREREQNTPVDTPKTANKGITPKKVYRVPLKTKKRLEQEREYYIICGIVDRKAKEKKKWECFFCGEKFRLDYTPDHHHIDGREGEALVREEDIVIAHRSCHNQYHHRSVHKITWFREWLEKVRTSRPGLYYKEKLKLEK